MNPITPQNVEYLLSLIKDGNLFEDFSKQYLSHILGYTFQPHGGIKDRGIDGLEHILINKTIRTHIYQISIEGDALKKIRNTIEKLRDNAIPYEKLYYVSNRRISNSEVLEDTIYKEYKKHTRIFDSQWLAVRVNTSQGTINTYNLFVNTHFQKFTAPGSAFPVYDLAGDPRLYVFLEQQFAHNESQNNLEDILYDSLILYSLEGTDPDKAVAIKEEAIIANVSSIIKREVGVITNIISARLRVLSSRPRKIRYDKRFSGYVLPYETRIAIRERNISDAELCDIFHKDSEDRLKQYLHKESIHVKECLSLVDKTLHKIYYQQGLEFAQIILRNENPEPFDKSLPDIISQVVEESSVVHKNRESVKRALLMAIRDMVYNGTISQKKYLRALSNTYTMLFLLQLDPKVAAYFKELAARLELYVCTSIIIPALSEYFLEDSNKRYWALLKGATASGTRLIINENILDELVKHFGHIKHEYEAYYRYMEDELSESENGIILVDNIMIRAYFYAKSRKQASSFNDFLNNFINPTLASIREELVEFLQDQFGIEYIPDTNRNIKIDEDEYRKLFAELGTVKRHADIARNHARICLGVYSLRERNNEIGESGVFGYFTWWLSTDIKTYGAVKKELYSKYNASCYMRPDFLYNYISLAPSKQAVDQLFDNMFPTLLGVNISYHLPEEAYKGFKEMVSEFKTKTPARKKAIIKTLSDKLKTESPIAAAKHIKKLLE